MRARTAVIVSGLVAMLVLSGCAAPSPGSEQSAKSKEATKTVAATQTVKPAQETTVVTDGKRDIAGVIAASESLSTFEQILKASGLEPALKSKKRRLTVFAPTDAAFSRLGTAAVDALLQPENKAKAQQLVRAHMVMEAVPMDQLATIRTALTFEGQRLRIGRKGSTIVINKKVTVKKGNIRARNGLVDAVDGVLLPPGFKP